MSRVPPPLPLWPLPPPRPISRPPPRRPSHPLPSSTRPLCVQWSPPAAVKRARPALQPSSRCSRRSRCRSSVWRRPAAPILLSLRRCSLQRELRSRKDRPVAPADREINEKNMDRPNRLAVRTRTKGQCCSPRPRRPDCVSTRTAAPVLRVPARCQCLARTWCFRAPPLPRPPLPLPLQPPPLRRCGPFLRGRPLLSGLPLRQRWPTVPKSLFSVRKRPRRVAPPLVQSPLQSSPGRSRPPWRRCKPLFRRHLVLLHRVHSRPQLRLLARMRALVLVAGPVWPNGPLLPVSPTASFSTLPASPRAATTSRR